MILQRAAQVFNRKGYFGTSIADIMEATGLEKGGIYNYFQSKDDLALQAFDYAVDQIREEFAHAIKGKIHAIDRLQAIIGVFRKMPDGYPFEGGCPVLNTTVEADYAHPALRQRSRQAMQEWHDFIHRIVERGIEREEICPESDPDAIASVLIAALEGAVVLANLYGNSAPMNHVVDHLNHYLSSLLCS